MAFPSVYEMNNLLTTVRKQHFWEYFSGAGVSFTTESAYNYTAGSENSDNIGNGTVTDYGQKLESGHSGIGKTILKITTPMKKYGSPTGYATARVYAGNGTTVLAESSGLDVSTLTGTYVDKTFVLNNPATLETNSRVTVHYTGGDSSNYINIGVGNVGGAGSNTSSTRHNGSSWGSPTTRDARMQFDSSATTYTLPSSRWTATKVNPPASFAMNNLADGGFRITADGGANNEGMINFNNSNRAFSKTGSVCIWVGRDVQTSSYTGYYGLANGITGNDSDMGQLATVYNTSANGVIALRTGNTTKGNTESTIALDTNFHTYKIEMKTSSAEWSVDGVAQTARTSTLPTLDLQPVAGVHGNNKSIDVKYCEVYNT